MDSLSKQSRWHCKLEQLMAVLETATTIYDNYVRSAANHGDILQDQNWTFSDNDWLINVTDYLGYN